MIIIQCSGGTTREKIDQWSRRESINKLTYSHLVIVVVIYLLNKFFQNVAAYKAYIYLSSHIVSLSRKFWSSLAGWFWLRVCLEVAVKLTAAGCSTHFQPHSGLIGQEASFSSLSHGSLHKPSQQLVSFSKCRKRKRTNERVPKMESTVFHSLIL